jgi:1-deoxy-D-xylulose-5-phosphate reductoisomerase
MGEVIEQTMERATFIKEPTYETYVATDDEARRIAAELL